MLTSHIDNALAAPNPNASLEILVRRLDDEGHTRQQIYDAMLNYLKTHQEDFAWQALANYYNGDHPLESMLDRLAGWCIVDQTLLPCQPFTNE